MKPTLPNLIILLCFALTVSSCEENRKLVEQNDKGYEWNCDECTSIDRFRFLRDDDDGVQKRDAWQRFVADPANGLKGMHNIESFYIDKIDLMKLLCDSCNDVEGIVVTLGYEPGTGFDESGKPDTTTIRPRKLIPYISAAKMSRNMYAPVGNANLHTIQGCPSDWCGANTAITTNQTLAP